MDISLLNLDRETGEITFGLRSKTVKGVEKLLQVVILSLRNSPGKDIIEPERGGGLDDMISGNMDPNDFTEIVADLTQRIRKTQAETLESQAGVSVPASERLKEIEIRDVLEGDSEDQVRVHIRVVNELGQSAEATV